MAVAGTDVRRDLCGHLDTVEVHLAKGLAEDPRLFENVEPRVHEDDQPTLDPAEPSLSREGELERFDPHLDAGPSRHRGQCTHDVVRPHPSMVPEIAKDRGSPGPSRNVSGVPCCVIT